MGLEPSNSSIEELLHQNLKWNLVLNYATLGGGVGLFTEVIGSIKVAICWFFSGRFFLDNLIPKGTLITLVSSFVFKSISSELISQEELDYIAFEETNVIRVPFGRRLSKKKRPEKNQHIATLILPITSVNSPTPPPNVA